MSEQVDQAQAIAGLVTFLKVGSKALSYQVLAALALIIGAGIWAYALFNPVTLTVVLAISWAIFVFLPILHISIKDK
jgi:hypothetical protein